MLQRTDFVTCEFPSSQFSPTPLSPHEMSFNLNSTPPTFEDEDISINLDSPPSLEQASGSPMNPSSLNGLLHCMPSFYEEGEASMVTILYL